MLILSHADVGPNGHREVPPHFMLFQFRLGAEFAQRETEREQLMSRRVGEYEKMEKQLKKALQEAKKGELTVLEQEKELTRMRDDLQKEKDRIRQDVKTTIEQQKRELNGILKVSHVSIFSLFECALLVQK